MLLLTGCSDHKSKEQNQTPQENKTSTPNLPKAWEFCDQKSQSMRFERTPEGLKIQPAPNAPVLLAFLSLEPKFVPYSALLNHLAGMFKGVRFVGVLDRAYAPEQIQHYVKAYAPQFTLLNPIDDPSSLKLFLQTNTWNLPYFLLYNQEGVLQQSYRGAIVEEMLSKDIQDLLQR
ncbi:MULTISPECIES: TlpA family protein disulfide reductase [Helicobacter]|uniref:TlpA family protein disulfide reductase n=1 Tax=Helicobacter TaxID=209 RepID=UPI001F0A8EBA|nr:MULTISPECIES: hypothetical protein [Helicobacter]